ncbi:MAG: hypothetical protein ACE5EF_14080, partial [Dehalococcoidia bacterium]
DRTTLGAWLAAVADERLLLGVLGAGVAVGAGFPALWACAALSAVSISGRLVVLRATGGWA